MSRRAFMQREAAPIAAFEECASCEAAGATDGLCADCLSFVRIAGNTHEDMVLEIGTATDEVGPAVAAFARVITDPARRH